MTFLDGSIITVWIEKTWNRDILMHSLTPNQTWKKIRIHLFSKTPRGHQIHHGEKAIKDTCTHHWLKKNIPR